MTISEEIIKELIHFFHSFSLFMSSLCPAYVQLMSESGHKLVIIRWKTGKREKGGKNIF